jgi:hypothetical protein
MGEAGKKCPEDKDARWTKRNNRACSATPTWNVDGFAKIIQTVEGAINALDINASFRTALMRTSTLRMHRADSRNATKTSCKLRDAVKSGSVFG